MIMMMQLSIDLMIDSTDSTETDTAQQLVNQTILQQLEKISARLDTLEKNNCKKTVDQ